MARKYKIIYDRNLCIGAGTCVAINPKSWELDNSDNKANLLNSKPKEENIDTFELEIDESTFNIEMEAAKGCPVNCIHIIDVETGEQLI